MMIGHTPRMPQRLPRAIPSTAPSGSPAMPAMPFPVGLEMPPAGDPFGRRYPSPQPLLVISADPAPALSKLLWAAQVGFAASP